MSFLASQSLAFILLIATGCMACRVSLHAHSEVEGPRIFLRDIADIQCPGDVDLPLVDLGEAAHFGLTRLIDVERLQSNELSAWQGRLVLASPGRTLQATTVADTLPANELSVLIDSLFASEPLKPREQRKISLYKAPSIITLPHISSARRGIANSRKLELVFGGLKRRGKVPLELRIGKGADVLRRIPLTVNVRILGPVAIAKVLLRRGERFSPGTVKEEMKDITSYPPGSLPSMAECLGNLASQTVTAGRLITMRLVDIPPLFRKGERVPLVIEEGSVHVSIDAVARRDGRAGEVIPVWNPVNRKMIHAYVRENGTLKLMAEGG